MYLKQRGAEPVILERGRTGMEASWAGAGILCPIQPWLYPDAFSHLVQASLAMYPDLQDYLLTETGISMQWHRSGMMIPFFDDDQHNHEQMATQWAARFGWPSEQVNANDCLDYEPCLSSEGLRSGLYWKDVAQLRNPRLLKAVRTMLDKMNVPVWEGCSVDGLIEEHGRICGVNIGQESMAADAVLLACGSWSGTFGKQIGLNIPVRPVKGQIVLLKGNNMNVRHIVKHESMYLVPRLDGRVLVGASMEDNGFTRGNTVRVVQQLLAAVMRITPGIADLEIEQQWMGFRPGSPDGMPFIGSVEHKPGLWVATGHYRNGVALAPVTAEIITRQILGEEPLAIDIEPFEVCRTIENIEAVGYPGSST
jgi:glycine oxidase